MRVMWRRHGKEQTASLAPARPYTLADAESALAAVTKDPSFAKDFFTRFVVGSELPDYPALLARAGFLVARNSNVLIAGPTTIGSPMYDVGLSAGDRILTVGDASIATSEQLAFRATWVGSKQ